LKFNPNEILPYWLNRTTFLFRSIFDKRAEAFGVTWADGIILLKLSLGHNTLAELARNLEHSHPAILRHIDKLEEMGLVERTGHPEDRRVKILLMTEAGKETAANLQMMTQEISKEIQERFGKDRVALAIDLMQDIVSAYSSDEHTSCPAAEDTDQSDEKAGHE